MIALSIASIVIGAFAIIGLAILSVLAELAAHREQQRARSNLDDLTARRQERDARNALLARERRVYGTQRNPPA